MKTLAFLFVFIFAVGFAQAQDNQPQEPVKVKELPEPGCIIWPAELNKTVPQVFDADEFYRNQVLQPWGEVHCYSGILLTENGLDFSAFGPGPLNKELPMVSTLTGTVFTFDYIRNTDR